MNAIFGDHEFALGFAQRCKEAGISDTCVPGLYRDAEVNPEYQDALIAGLEKAAALDYQALLKNPALMGLLSGGAGFGVSKLLGSDTKDALKWGLGAGALGAGGSALYKNWPHLAEVARHMFQGDPGDPGDLTPDQYNAIVDPETGNFRENAAEMMRTGWFQNSLSPAQRKTLNDFIYQGSPLYSELGIDPVTGKPLVSGDEIIRRGRAYMARPDVPENVKLQVAEIISEPEGHFNDLISTGMAPFDVMALAGKGSTTAIPGLNLGVAGWSLGNELKGIAEGRTVEEDVVRLSRQYGSGDSTLKNIYNIGASIVNPERWAREPVVAARLAKDVYNKGVNPFWAIHNTKLSPLYPLANYMMGKNLQGVQQRAMQSTAPPPLQGDAQFYLDKSLGSGDYRPLSGFLARTGQGGTNAADRAKQMMRQHNVRFGGMTKTQKAKYEDRTGTSIFDACFLW